MNELSQISFVEGEISVLGSILRGGESIVQVLDILGQKRKVFHEPVHQYIFETCLELYNQSKPIDLVTISEALDQTRFPRRKADSWSEYLLDIVEAAALGTDLRYNTEKLKEKAIFRELEAIAQEISTQARSARDLENTLDYAQQALFGLSQDQDKKTLTPISQISNSVWDQIEQRANSTSPLLGLDTGFIDLNDMTLGLQPSDFIVIAARPSMGKTAFCLNVASHIAYQHKSPVAVFSLEMSKDQLVQRLISLHSQIDSQRIRTGKNLTEQDWDLLGKSIGELSEASLYIDDSPMITVMDIRAKARRFKANKKDLGLIVVDYLQLMKGGGTENRTQELSEISRGLKTLARELDIPIIALSQLSRGVESRPNKRPMLSDLRESGAIEQDADLVMFLYRHEYYDPEDTDNRGICEVIIGKQRNGPTGTIKLQFHASTTRFRNLANVSSISTFN